MSSIDEKELKKINKFNKSEFENKSSTLLDEVAALGQVDGLQVLTITVGRDDNEILIGVGGNIPKGILPHILSKVSERMEDDVPDKLEDLIDLLEQVMKKRKKDEG